MKRDTDNLTLHLPLPKRADGPLRRFVRGELTAAEMVRDLRHSVDDRAREQAREDEARRRRWS